MSKQRSVIGIDLGTDSVKAVALDATSTMYGATSATKETSAPKVLAACAAESKGMRKGVVIEPENVASSIKEVLKELGGHVNIKTSEVYMAMGGVGLGFQKSKGLVAISRADGEVTKEDMRRAVDACETGLSKIQNREILHKIPILYKIDNETITHDPVGLSGIKLEAEVMFITAFVQNIKNALKALEEADLDVEEIVAGPIASAQAILDKREKEVGSMILDLGASTTSLILFEEKLPYSVDVIPFGSGHITQDIAVVLRTSLEEAEKLKLNYGLVGSDMVSSKKDDLINGFHSKKKLTEIIESRLSDIFELVDKHLKKVDRAGLLPAGIMIIGGGANLPGIENFAKAELKLPARIAEPRNLEGLKDKARNPAWSTALGAAKFALEKQSAVSPLLRGQTGSILRWFRAFLP